MQAAPMEEITLYAVWDDYPWIIAGDLYFSLEEAQKNIEDFQNKQIKESKRKMVDFAQAEKELVKNIKKAGASKL